MWVLTVAVALLGSFIGTHAEIEYCHSLLGTSGEGKTEGNLLQPLNTEAPLQTQLFTSMAMTSHGRITSWEVFSSGPGNFYALVWRNLGNNQYKLMGRNAITIVTEGLSKFEIPVTQNIIVEQGDMIGLAYDSFAVSSPLYLEVDGTDVMENPPLRTKDAPVPGRTLTIDRPAEKLYVGGEYNLTETGLNSVATIRASIRGINPNNKLAYGPTPNEGCAMILKESWGTICDKWYVNRGWPLLFCRTMGYPNVIMATNATKMGMTCGDETTSIHSENPRCKVSNDHTEGISQCDRHPKGCTHADDLYIKCKPKVNFLGKTESIETVKEGIPVAFECGYWGSICDNRDPSEHYQNRTRSWVTGFCKTLGFSGFESITRVTDAMLQEVNVALPDDVKKNIVCDVTVVNNIDECRSRPLNKNYCDREYYYVTCDDTQF